MKVKLNNHEVKELLIRITKGDTEAVESFCVLLRPYLKQISAKYHFMIESINSDINVVLVKILTKIQTIDLSVDPMPFIARTMINHCIDQSRIYNSKKRIKKHNVEDIGSMRQFNNAVEPTISLDMNEFVTLTELDKKFIKLKWIDCLPKEKIIEELKINKTQYKAKTKLLEAKIVREVLNK